MYTFLVIHTSRCTKIEYPIALMCSQQDIVGTVANARVQEHHQSGWTVYLISQKVVQLERRKTSESEEQNDNASGDKVDEEHETEPETDIRQSLSTQPAQEVTPSRSERSHYLLQASTRKPSRFLL